MKIKICFILASSLFLVAFINTLHAATISGTVSDSAGNPINGTITQIYVHAEIGDPCGWREWKGSAMIDSNGSFTIQNLPAGTYFLRADNMNQSNYVREYWTGDVPDPSHFDCSLAQSFTAAAAEVVSGKDFQLDTGGGTLSGTVTDSNGAVIPGTQIDVQAIMGDPCGWHKWMGSAMTNPDGSYAIQGLPAGTYYLQANNMSQSNYVNEWWTGGDPDPSNFDCNQAQGSTVAAGGDVSGRNFRLDMGGTVSGTVTDSNGAVIPGTQIDVHAIMGHPCGWQQWVGSAMTNPDGSYAIQGLPTGTYYVQTYNMSQSNYVNEWWTGAFPDPSNFDCNQAQGSTVAAGGDVSGRNFRLDMGGTISGTVRDSDGDAITAVQITVHADTGDPCGWRQTVGSGTTSSSDGTYAIMGLPPGAYYLQTNNMTQSNYVNEWWTGGDPDPSNFDCNQAQGSTVTAGGEVSGKDFRLDTGGTVSGTVYHSNGSDPIEDAMIEVQAFRATPDGGRYWTASGWTNQTNGTYTIAGLPQGLYYLQTSNMGANYLNAWWAETGSVLDGSGAGSFTLSEGAVEYNKNFQLDIGATISGTATGSGPLANITVVAVPFNCYLNQPAFWPDCSRYSACTDFNGQYVLNGLPYDSYRVYAFGPGDCSGGNYLAEFYPEKERQGDAEPVILSASSPDANGIDFTLDLLDDSRSTPGLNIFATGRGHYGTLTWSTSTRSLLLHRVRVFDYDGILADGSSHSVTVEYPGGAIKSLSLIDKWDRNTGLYHRTDSAGPFFSGDYIYRVTDSQGNTSTVTDNVQINALSAPDINSFTPTVGSESITAYIDNVFINGSSYDNFTSGTIDLTKWTSAPSWADASSGELKITQDPSPGYATQWLWLQNPTSVQKISADVRVSSISSDIPEARIGGSFCNDGQADLFARIWIKGNKIGYRVFRVFDWYNFKFESSLVSEEIVSATLGQTYRLTIEWDGTKFTFDVDGETRTYTPSGAIQEPNRYIRGVGTNINNKVPDTTPTFDWATVPNAKAYRVNIWDQRGHYLVSFWTPSPPFTIPPGYLEPYRRYEYRIQVHRDHWGFELDNGSGTPGSSSDYITFNTYAETQTPYTDTSGSFGVRTWNDSFMGQHLSFYIEVSDAQGVPDNIRSVTVTFPDGSTQLPLYFDHSITPFKAVYRNNYYGQIQNSTYTFRIEDKDGNEFQTSEDLTSNPVGYPSEDSLTANGDASYHSVIGNTGLTIAWAGGTGFYEVSIRDKDLNDLYSFKTENTQFTIPPGLLAENALYRYSIVPHGEFYENNAQNRALSPWIPLMFKSFLTTPFLPGGGGSSPTLSLTEPTDTHRGVATFHVIKATTGEDRYQLVAIVKVTDPDGVPRNIESVQVQYPDQTWKDMVYYRELSPTEAEYIRIDTFTESTDITQGTYTFRVTDCDGNTTPIAPENQDDLEVNILPIVSTSTPGQGTVISGTTPTIQWSAVAGPTTRYQVRIYDRWLGYTTLHWSPYLTETSYTVPEGVLEFDKCYHYQIYAYREAGPGEDIDNYSVDHLYPGERSSFSTLLVLGDVNGDLVVDLADALLVLQILVGITPTQDINLYADVNGDGKIGTEELIYILQEVSDLR
jgi:hypothetical protein